jgi:C-terminal processing protease CtpA/Prc
MSIERAGAGVLILSMLLVACGTSPSTPPEPQVTASPAAKSSDTAAPVASATTTPTPSMPPEVAAYLTDALDVMQANSVNKHKVDWAALRADIMKSAAAATTISDTYPLIKLALSRLGDHHSLFMDPQKAAAEQQGTNPVPEKPTVKLVNGRIGYVLVPGYLGLNQDLLNRYGTDMQQQIQAVDRGRPCGWVVDLRGNEGGNMWPMLIGIGPILGEGKAGSWVDAEGSVTAWAYVGGEGLAGTAVQSQVIGKPHLLASPGPPVAVLFGGDTASSGEIIAISFIGRPHARSFGGNSYGDTTANSGFPLSDGALIFLTTAVDADRTGRTYGDPLVPDVPVSGDNSRAGPIPTEALRWLGAQSACR